MRKNRNKLHNSKNFVSAIIAAHNEELHLSSCVESLINQSYKNIEIIIVENGESKDQTLNIAQHYAKRFKNIIEFSIPGKQNGPGNAWNFGIQKSEGDIILICGADLEYGKDYIKKGIKHLSKKNAFAIVHKEEKCKNLDNIWARAFFKKRDTSYTKGKSKVFSLIKKDYIKDRLFDSSLGYADDQTIYKKEGTSFPTVDLEVYHTNPSSFEDTWDHTRWVGKSLKSPIKILSILPIFPLYLFYKIGVHLKKDFYAPFIFFLPVYYSIRYVAYLIESVNYLKNRNKIF